MKECKVLKFQFSNSERLVKSENYQYKDNPTCEKVINEYLAEGWTVAGFCGDENVYVFVMLTR